MSWSLLLPVVIGFSTVFQAGLNRNVSRAWGLGATTLLSSAMLFGVSLLAWLLARTSPERVPELFRDPPGAFSQFSWWYWIPGALGFVIVAGIPFAIARIGALETFVALIGSQLVAGMVWDALAEGRPVNAVRVAGALLAFLAAALVNWKG